MAATLSNLPISVSLSLSLSLFCSLPFFLPFSCVLETYQIVHHHPPAMAIWPFGRKNKRHTIQLGDPETDPPLTTTDTTTTSTIPPESMSSIPPDPEPRLTRKKSKRQKNRHSQPVIHDPSSISSFHDVVATTTTSPLHHQHQQHPPPSTAHSQSSPRHQKNLKNPPSSNLLLSSSVPKQSNPRFDDYLCASHNHHHHQQHPAAVTTAMSRSTSVKGKRNGNHPNNTTTTATNTNTNNGHAVLKKRVSQRKLNKIAREQEIRLMASCPIDIPRRPGDHLSVGPVKRGPPRTRSRRRSDRHRSDTSLSVRDSAASSLSDVSEAHNTFKVNALAAFTPRPLVRYVDAPRLATSRSHNASAASTRREKLPALLTMSEEDLSKRRVERLADDLDAGGLRELLERDRRRREQKDIEDQGRAQRKLERSAERQRKAERRAQKEGGEQKQEEQGQEESAAAPAPAPEPQEDPVVERPDSENYDGNNASRQRLEFLADTRPQEQTGSWLRDSSKGPSHSIRESVDVDSVNVIGNIDDSSIREPPKLGQRPSFAPSHDMGMSRSTLSPSQSQSQSPSRHGVGSPASSQIYGMARESMSDASRTLDSERRMSDHSGRRTNTFSSLFRRGSSRLKRRYRERFQDQPSDLSNTSRVSHASHTSHESFSRIPTQSSGPAPSIPQRPYLRSTGTVKRSQSKFTEHFGDEPLSPPDSRLQSPDIAEEPAEHRGIPIGTAYPIIGSDPDLPARRNNHRSWMTDSVDAESEHVPLSQSLASIDSEGSWMSGHFLRRISQRRLHQPVRHSTGQFESGPDEQPPPPHGEDPSGTEPFVRFSTTNDEERTSADAVEEPDTRPEAPHLADEDPAETWHTEVAKRPVLVNPTARPKSTEGLLKNIQSLSPISGEEEFSPIEEHSAELDYATDEDQQDHIS